MRSQLDIAKPPMLMSEDLYWTENNMECCFNEYEVNFILKDNNYPIRQEDFEIPLDIL